MTEERKDELLKWFGKSFKDSPYHTEFLTGGDDVYQLSTRLLGQEPKGGEAIFVDGLTRFAGSDAASIRERLGAMRALDEAIEAAKQKSVYFLPSEQATTLQKMRYPVWTSKLETQLGQKAENARVRRFEQMLGKKAVAVGYPLMRISPFLALALLLGGGAYALSRDSSTT